MLRERLEPSDGGFFAPLKSFLGFGPPRELTPAEKQKKEMDGAIDEVLKGTGVLGSVLGSVFKRVVGVAGGMMAQTANDMAAVRTEAERVLSASPDALRSLGGDIEVGAPYSSSFSSSSFNGVATKQVVLVCPIRGSKHAGQIQVRASVDGERVVIDELLLDGQRLDQGPTRPGEARPYIRRKDDNVIDV